MTAVGQVVNFGVGEDSDEILGFVEGGEEMV